MNRVALRVLYSLPEFYFGANCYNYSELLAVSSVILRKAPFRYYGNRLSHEVERFEEKCKTHYGVNHVHAVNSGTGALSCALHALDVGPGDEVILPGFFWVSVSNAVLLRGAIPVFCEIDDTFNADVEDLSRKLTPRTKCVVVVHMEGAQAPIDRILSLCRASGVKVLEDFSQCSGASLHGRPVGSFGDISISSLQLNKIVTCGEGGVLLTDSEDYYHRIVARSDFGFQRFQGTICSDKDNTYITYGEGRRFDEISGAIMNVQMRKLPSLIQRMRSNKLYIKSFIGDIAPIKYRSLIDDSGDTGYSIIMSFPSSGETDRFLSLYDSTYPGDPMRLYRLSETGFHIYYNCTNVVEKTAVLPGGFPWTMVDIARYSYGKGTLPYTDDLLARSVALRLPANLSRLERAVLARCMKHLIDEYRRGI